MKITIFFLLQEHQRDNSLLIYTKSKRCTKKLLLTLYSLHLHVLGVSLADSLSVVHGFPL